MDVLDVMDVMDVSNAHILAKNEDIAMKLSGYHHWGQHGTSRMSLMTQCA